MNTNITTCKPETLEFFRDELLDSLKQSDQSVINRAFKQYKLVHDADLIYNLVRDFDAEDVVSKITIALGSTYKS